MSFVRMLTWNEQSIDLPTWTQVVGALLDLKGFEEAALLLAGDDGDSYTVVHFFAGYGFFVSTAGIGDEDGFGLLDENHGDEVVGLWCSGDFRRAPRNRLVSDRLLLRVLRTFYDSGYREHSAHWVVEENQVVYEI